MESEKVKRYFQKIWAYLYGTHGIILSGYLFFIFAVQVFGAQGEGISVRTVLLLLLLLILLAEICPVILRKAETLQITLWENQMCGKKKVLWISAFFIVCFLVLIHWYLAYYPGAFSIDAVYQYKQVVSGRYNDWKPILQTLITYTLPLKLTGKPEAIVLFQIIEYSCVLTYMGYVILKYSSKWFAVLALLYILLNPATGNIVVYPWKDVTFAMFAVLLMAFGLQVHITDGKWLDSKKTVFLLGAVLTAATVVRHNGFLFTVPFLAAVLVRTNKKRRIQVILLFLVCASVIKGPLKMALEVPETWNHTTRVMGLPMSMLGNIAKESPESLDDTTKEFMYSVASPKDWKEKYVCGNFDSIKWQCDQEAIEEAGAARILWMTVKSSVKAPAPALRGLFCLTDIVYTINGNLDWNLKPAMAENDVGLEFREIYGRDAVETYTDFSRTGIFKYLFWYIGVLNLAVIFSVLCKCRFQVKNDWKKILFALPVLCYNFGTMLLLTGNDFRYFYLNFPICPVIILILFGEIKEKQGTEISKKRIYKKIDIWGIYNKLTALPELGPAYFLFVFLLSAMIIIGGKINVAEAPYFHDLFILDYIWIGLLCGMFFMIGKVLTEKINEHLKYAERTEAQSRWWPGSFLFLTIAWTPYFLAYYPGIITWDSLTSLEQVKGVSDLYNHIPIAYTLLIALFARIGWRFGDANFGICLFSLVQLLLMAVVLSYSVYWIRTRISKNKVLSFGLLIFYGLNPVIALYSVTMWKDVLFSAWIVLLCLFLADVGMSGGKVLEKKKGLARLGILFLLVAFGRNNGIYVIVLCWTVLLLCYKNIRKKLFAAGGAVILLIVLVQGPGYKALEIDQAGFAESVGIPLQQISYTIVRDGNLKEEDKEFIEKIIPIRTIEENYSPVLADNIKFNSEFDTAFFEENKVEFLKLYLRLLPANLPCYVQSYLLSTVGFWHIEPIEWLGAEGVNENEMGIYGVDYLKKCLHLDWRENMSAALEGMRKWPVTNVGLLVWLVFFYILISFIQKQPWKALLALPLVGCWLTIMIATPVCSQFRYVYYYYLILPVVCVMIFVKMRVEPEEKGE